MSYTIDFKKKGFDLLVDLINYDNGTSFVAPEIQSVTPPQILYFEQRNTRTTITTTDPEFDVNSVEVDYNRIDIAALFALVGCRVQEVDLDKNEDDFVLNEKFFVSIKRRYGIECTEEDFELSISEEGIISINAKVGSYSYVGKTNVEVIPSLASQLPIRALDGFRIAPYGKKWILVPNDAYPVGSVYIATSKFAAPQHVFGGEWSPVPTIEVDTDQMFYYNHPIGYAIDLNEVDVPLSDAYRFIALHDDATYNEGIAVLNEEETGWEITDQRSPYYGETIRKSPSNRKTFMMVYKSTDRITSETHPEYAWVRTK